MQTAVVAAAAEGAAAVESIVGFYWHSGLRQTILLVLADWMSFRHPLPRQVL